MWFEEYEKLGHMKLEEDMKIEDMKLGDRKLEGDVKLRDMKLGVMKVGDIVKREEGKLGDENIEDVKLEELVVWRRSQTVASWCRNEEKLGWVFEVLRMPNSSSLSIAILAASGLSSDVDSPDSDDEPDPDADTLALSLLSAGNLSRLSNSSLPVKLSSPFRELYIGFESVSVKFRSILLLFGTNTYGDHRKLNKDPVFRVHDCYCSRHFSPRCSPLWPTRFLRMQYLDSIPPPLTITLCVRRCYLHGCFPGTEARRSFIVECCYWFSSASSFDCFLGSEARKLCTRFPLLYSSWMESVLKSVAVVAVAFLSIHSPLWIEESLKFSFISIKFEVFSSEIIWNFFILSALIYVMFCVLVCFHLFVSEDSRASESRMSRFVIVL